MKKIKNLSIIMFILAELCQTVAAKSSPILKNSVWDTMSKGEIVKDSNLIISGRFVGTNVPKEVSLLVWDDIISFEKRLFSKHRRYTAAIKNGKFSFTADQVKKTAYISFGWGSSGWDTNIFEYLETYLVSPGDKVTINILDYKPQNRNIDNDNIAAVDSANCINCKKFSFSGIGSSKYQCRYEMDMIRESSKARWGKISSWMKNKTLRERLDYREADVNSYKFDQVSHLEKYRNKISPEVFSLLYTDILSSAAFRLSWQAYSRATVLENLKMDEVQRDEEKMLLRDFLVKLTSWTKGIEPDILAHSAQYSKFLINTLSVESTLLGKETIHDMIVNRFTGVLRERLITANILDNASNWAPEIFNRDTKSAEMLVKIPEYKMALDSILSATVKGSKVYNFSLLDITGKVVRLEDFKGKVVFIDFWFVGCGGCSHYYKTVLSKTEEEFKNNPDVVFITMSIDRDRDKWMKGVNSGEYTSKHVINLHSKEGVSDPIIKKFNVLAYPHPVLIDRDGRLFSNSNQELRDGGVAGLTNAINKALAVK